ncbi:hypothetical protein K435DRAFT_810457 [Dendrothele bispora CBS 962.96]|uniref:Uncharacterized protein n=1 Tax=Dendrothele bispora (strain CBS 962.96) TaxID=1314807 RepID=A0A4S8KV19_DENBC|nr:hypothetical protein K435DRAFT_810457 [Dendrothele bispora CBS 962.96]
MPCAPRASKKKPECLWCEYHEKYEAGTVQRAHRKKYGPFPFTISQPTPVPTVQSVTEIPSDDDTSVSSGTESDFDRGENTNHSSGVISHMDVDVDDLLDFDGAVDGGTIELDAASAGTRGADDLGIETIGIGFLSRELLRDLHDVAWDTPSDLVEGEGEVEEDIPVEDEDNALTEHEELGAIDWDEFTAYGRDGRLSAWDSLGQDWELEYQNIR